MSGARVYHGLNMYLQCVLVLLLDQGVACGFLNTAGATLIAE